MNKKTNVIFAIETSCDDTALAIIANHKIIANEVLTFNDDHKKYGGIIPELAARNHAKYLNDLGKKILNQVNLKWEDIDKIAYTAKPGLPGCLHTGKVYAKSLAFLLNKELIPIDHMIGHAFSFSIDKQEEIDYPFICLDASGGHTIIYLFNSLTDYSILNQSVDDAVGECLDKIGRILNLPYPGGVNIDKTYDESKTNIKMIAHHQPSDNFSFSGLKTHVSNLVNSLKMKHQEIDIVSIASSAQKWCIDDLIRKVKYYISLNPNVKFLAVGGGVSANSLLRKELKLLPIKSLLSDKKYSGDNAAMIANIADIIVNSRNN